MLFVHELSALLQNHFLNNLLDKQLTNINVSLLITEMEQELSQFWDNMICITALMQAL